jgi:hypothetical protein
MEPICSPKRRFELELHGTESQKAPITGTVAKVSQKTVFFRHNLYSSMERLIYSVSTATQAWNPITLRNPEDGSHMCSETSVLTRATRYRVSEGIYIISKSATFCDVTQYSLVRVE